MTYYVHDRVEVKYWHNKFIVERDHPYTGIVLTAVLPWFPTSMKYLIKGKDQSCMTNNTFISREGYELALISRKAENRVQGQRPSTCKRGT